MWQSHIKPYLLPNRKIALVGRHEQRLKRRGNGACSGADALSLPSRDRTHGRFARDMLKGRKWGQEQGKEVAAGPRHLQAVVWGGGGGEDSHY